MSIYIHVYNSKSCLRRQKKTESLHFLGSEDCECVLCVFQMYTLRLCQSTGSRVCQNLLQATAKQPACSHQRVLLWSATSQCHYSQASHRLAHRDKNNGLSSTILQGSSPKLSVLGALLARHQSTESATSNAAQSMVSEPGSNVDT